MDESVGRHALRLGRPEIAPMGRLFPDPSLLVEIVPELLASSVVRAGRRSQPQPGMRSRSGSTCVSSTYFMKTAGHCNCRLRNNTKWLV